MRVPITAKLVADDRTNSVLISGEKSQRLRLKALVTHLDMIMTFASKEIRDAAVSTGMTDGMEMGYQRLDKLFAEQQAG